MQVDLRFVGRSSVFAALVCGSCLAVRGQNSASLNILLSVDYSSAERTVEIYQGFGGSPHDVAELRGSQIAAATSAFLAQRRMDPSLLERALQSAKFNQRIDDDVLNMARARSQVQPIKELLEAMQRRNFSQRVVSTVEQLFPVDARVTARIPMFVVAFGPQTIDAFVRRVEWSGQTPRFVNEGQGELVIVVNLARAVGFGYSVDERFVGVLSVVAHEVFHAAFGAYKDGSQFWRQYYPAHQTPFDQLLDIAHNEGIAYYLSLVQRSRGKFSSEEERRIRSAIDVFNRNAEELLSPRLTQQRAMEILRLANTSGYWENYACMAGMIVARQIDQSLGRSGLSSTIATGPYAFFQKYTELMKQDSNLPRLSPAVMQTILTRR